MTATFSSLTYRYLKVKSIESSKSEILINFKSKRKTMLCPDCGSETSKHTTYFNRTLQDLPIIDKALILNIRLKKFGCENPDCSRKVFSESIIEIAREKGRRTSRLEEMMIRLAMTYSAEGAANLLKSKHIEVSGDTLLRITKKWAPQIDYSAIEAIGIYDFALKKIEFMERFL
ncbi:transposase family protein [Andreesenia angusta]